MSFMGGAECSTSGNPLSQFQKHVQDDKTLQRDRLVNRGPGAGLNGFRSAGSSAPQDEVSAVAMHEETNMAKSKKQT
jgi:peroxin-5